MLLGKTDSSFIFNFCWSQQNSTVTLYKQGTGDYNQVKQMTVFFDSYGVNRSDGGKSGKGVDSEKRVGVITIQGLYWVWN